MPDVRRAFALIGGLRMDGVRPGSMAASLGLTVPAGGGTFEAQVHGAIGKA